MTQIVDQMLKLKQLIVKEMNPSHKLLTKNRELNLSYLSYTKDTKDGRILSYS